MKFEHYMKKLLESEVYKEFKKKHPSAYFCAGFFILDFETGKDIHQIDYMLKDNKIATFSLDEGVNLHISHSQLGKKLPKIEGEIITDLKALKGIVEDEMKNRMITDNIKKMVVVLQVIDGKRVWNLNCITDNLNVLQVHIDDADQTILKFMKYSIFDFVKSMPKSITIPKSGKMQPPSENQPASEPPSEED